MSAVLAATAVSTPAAGRAGGPEQRGHVQELGRIDVTFPAHGTVLALARRAARSASVTWGSREVRETVLLVLSELLGNAVKAATGGSVSMALSWTARRVRIEVADDSSAEPVARRAQLADEGGRGLWLVEVLAVRWGSHVTSKGKCVWAEVALPG